ncbi:HupV protein [Azoarcus sp. DD4]|uniref:nickel-dependent hydrogenase large subunit n=1 Tax=Azoarcus sp. DD4 TaxID=2027405 RepID=UPI00112D1663|nr:nickel-dependent hydrogenase large subunit [Azoarcus sp. DD4]QDF99384.1 HupV protein [Azoarcus sp. DD4]
MTRVVVGPFNRVEGDLEVTLDVADGRVAAARVNSPLFRGFEQILGGKDPRDALVFVPRICGICSVSQSAAAAAALREVMGLTVPANGERAANVVLAAENLADHFTHFYLFFMPDFARDAYRGRPWFDTAHARFKAVEGSAAADALPARAAFLQLMGVLAGKWPHTLSLQPGGSAKAVSAAEKIRLFALLREFRGWLERRLFGDSLEAVAALDSVAALDAWADARAPQHSDFRLFIEIARDLGLQRIGRATDVFLSYGAYGEGDKALFARGVWRPGAEPAAFDPALIVEDVSHAWLRADAARHPWQGHTWPDADKTDAYSWCKAPRLGGEVVECGALARQLVDGQPLLRELVVRDGGSVYARVLGRLLEFARVLPAMEAWVRAFEPGAPFCAQGELPDEAQGVGLVEAARGALGHWLVVRHGRIANYQIIAPTTWNFSPRDAAGTPGALEQALVGLPAGGDEEPLAVQHVVRSFDPCMVCTVH